MINKYFYLALICCFATTVIGYGQQLTQSNLPIILISSEFAIEDEPKTSALMRIIDNGPGVVNKINDNPSFTGRIGIEFRGSSSQWFPKKPYSIEVWDALGEDVDTTLMGMSSDADWVLNAAYNDKTLMRDQLTYILGGSIMEYAPRGKYCELMVNGSYEGIYILMEKIKRGKDRVPIDKLDISIVDGDKLTGGYIVKLDKDSGNPSSSSWNSKYASIPGKLPTPLFQIDYPSVSNINLTQELYIKNHFDKAEDAVFSNSFADPIIGFRKYFDEQSLIDFIIMNELAKNGDGYRLSTYMYKERDSDGGKIKMGPLWDFNLSFGNIDYCTGGNHLGLVIEDFNKVCADDYWVVHFWWKKFMSDKVFLDSLKRRYSYLRAQQLSDAKIFRTIDSIATLLKPAVDRNFARWPILGQYVWPNFFVGSTFNQELNFINNWTRMRLGYLDGLWLIKSPTVNVPNTNITIKPNPVKTNCIISIDTNSTVKRGPFVYTSAGALIGRPVIKSINDHSWELSLEPFPVGTYYVRYIDKDEKVHSTALMKI